MFSTSEVYGKNVEVPFHEDADLVMRLYDLRRETVLRASRAAINAEAKASGKDPLLLTIAAPAGVALRGLDLPKIWQPLD